MADYLQQVGRGWRILGIVGSAFASIVCLMLALLLWTDMVRRQSLNYEGKPLWIGAAVVALIGLASAFIAWRLVRRHVAANGVTVMPTWFIQLFGLLFLAGLCLVGYQRGEVLFLAEGASVCLAMIFLGRHLAKRQRPQV